MLKARTKAGTFILGLDAENIKRLQSGKPMRISLSELGGTGDIMIMAGETIADMMHELEKASGRPLPKPTTH